MNMMDEKNKKNSTPVVLIVDDRESARLLLRAAMEQAGFEVFEAKDAGGAFKVFKNHQPNIVLLDVVMPGIDGFEICQGLRKLPGGEFVPIIMTTASNDFEAIKRAYEVGATDFVTKPINYVILTHRVRYMLRAISNQENLAEQAVRDPLTGLYNRRYFRIRIEEEIKRADRTRQQLGVLLCNLDNFKSINEQYGQRVGDEVLKKAAKNILDCVRSYDQVFRWGGDEIIVLIPSFSYQGEVFPAQRIRDTIRSIPYQISLHHDLDVSIGVSFYPDHGTNPEELIRLADQALYFAKKSGCNIQIGEEEYRLTEASVMPVFQPVVDLNSRTISAYEALVRDPQHNLSVPELFKKYNDIGKLMDLKTVCFKQQIDRAAKLGLKKVFVNADFKLLEKIGSHPKPPGMEVVIEISEVEALLDVEKNLKMVNMWRIEGYKFAIDDFGAGFISLPFIAMAVPEFIKLDRSTMLLAVSSDKFRDFLKDLIESLSKYASEGIIAEGIETDHELKTMKEIGVHLAQGYLLGRPEELKPQSEPINEAPSDQGD